METQASGITSRERRRWAEIIETRRAPAEGEIRDSPISALLVAFRAEHKMTITELAARLGVPYRTLQSWERSEFGGPSHPKMILLALQSVAANLYT